MEKVRRVPINRIEKIDKALKQIETIAKQLLKEIGIKVHISGFRYWSTALIIMEENEMTQSNKISIMELYNCIARKHKTTRTRVERAMRYAYSELNLKQQFNVNYHINNTALLFLLKEEIDKQRCNNTKEGV